MKKLFSLLIAALFSATMFAADVYSIAGAPAILFGSEWNKESTATEMTLNGSVYQWTKTAVALPVCKIEFKVLKNHSYDNSWPAENKVCNIAKSGKYDVTITYHPDNNNVEILADLKEEMEVLPTITIHGNYSGSWAESNAFTPAADSKTASLKATINASATAYEFGIKENGTWISSSAISITRANPSAVISSGSGNATFAADATGEYTFTWTYATKTLAVTYPAEGSGGGITPVGFYITGDSALVVDAGLDKSKAWNPAALKIEKDTAILNLKAVTYALKVTTAGTWETAKGFSDLTETAKGLWKDKDNNICFALIAAGTVKVIYKAGLFKLEGAFDESKVPATPTLENGYYLIGQNGWDESALAANLKFASTETDGEYKLDVTLAASQEIKVVSVESNAIKTWYPDGMGNGYKVDAAHAGAKTIYFRPAGNDDWKTFNEGGFFFIAANEGGGGGEEPDPQFDGKFYITGESLVGSWEPNALACENGEHTFTNLQAGDYKFKITVDGTWETAKGFSDLASRPKGVTEGDNNNICFSLTTAGNVKVSFNGSKISLEGAFDESKEVSIADGYYLIGQNGWSLSALDASLKFEANTGSDGEYKLDVTLTAGQELKVVSVENSTIKTWYPDGMGNGYTVDAAHAGAKTVYFRPAGNADWESFVDGGFFFIEASEQGIGNTSDGVKAVKAFENGTLVIIKNGVKYNAQGVQVR